MTFIQRRISSTPMRRCINVICPLGFSQNRSDVCGCGCGCAGVSKFYGPLINKYGKYTEYRIYGSRIFFSVLTQKLSRRHKNRKNTGTRTGTTLKKCTEVMAIACVRLWFLIRNIHTYKILQCFSFYYYFTT